MNWGGRTLYSQSVAVVMVALLLLLLSRLF